jgi:hypothetical protein
MENTGKNGYKIWAKSSKRDDDSPITLAEHTNGVMDAFVYKTQIKH